MKQWIQTLKQRLIEGGEITAEEASRLIGISGQEDLDALRAAAHEITIHFHGRVPGICALVNAKSYLCAEDCGFCAQSVRYRTGASRYPLLSADKVLKTARRAETLGVKRFCVVTSGDALSDEEFEKIVEIFRCLGRETSLELDGSLGFLTPERIARLKSAGVKRLNSNLQTSPEFYPAIVSTHSYGHRIEALGHLKEGGMEICSGGILGMGETSGDRIQMAFELKKIKPRCLPVNILDPRPGTPLEGRPRADAGDVLKTIAVFRFIHPQAIIKLAGGKDANLSFEDQKKALRGGANGLIAGGYLTTSGNPMEKDFSLLKQAGYTVPTPGLPVSSPCPSA